MIKYVILESKSVRDEEIKPLLTLLKNLSLLGTQANPVAATTSKPTKLEDDMEKTFSSDSEHSDSEAQDRFQIWKIRLHALSCIGAVAKSSSKLFYGYWSLFIPSSPSPFTPTIFTSILHEPSAKVRTVAATTLTSIVEGSKTFLMSAEDSNKHRSFTSFSATLGAMVREIHNGLNAALDSEKHLPTYVQIIKVRSFFQAKFNKME